MGPEKQSGIIRHGKGVISQERIGPIRTKYCIFQALKSYRLSGIGTSISQTPSDASTWFSTKRYEADFIRTKNRRIPTYPKRIPIFRQGTVVHHNLARFTRGLSHRRFPLLIYQVHLPFAVAVLVQLAADQALDEVAFFVHDFLAASALNIDVVGI